MGESGPRKPTARSPDVARPRVTERTFSVGEGGVLGWTISLRNPAPNAPTTVVLVPNMARRSGPTGHVAMSAFGSGHACSLRLSLPTCLLPTPVASSSRRSTDVFWPVLPP